MRALPTIGLAAIATLVAWSGPVLAQPKPDCTPHMVEGRVVKVDTAQGKLTIQGSDGQTYEFNAPKEVLQDKKVGDQLEVKKRLPEGCK